MELELVCEGLEFPEGPIAMADGSVILVEIKGRRLSRVTPDGRRQTVADIPGGPNGAAVGPDEAIWITNNGGSLEWKDNAGLTFPGRTPREHVGGSIQRVDLDNGHVETIYESCDGARLIGPNDLVFDASGGFWFTDHGCITDEGRRYGALYYAQPDGTHIRRHRSRLVSPNGVGLSPDGGTLYVADTEVGRLWAIEVTGPGHLAPRQGVLPGRLVCTLPDYQFLDSLAVEAGGKVCVATVWNGGITTVDPEGNTEHFPVPDPICTNICFGGEDMRTAWITASSTGKLYRTRWPRPGLRLNFNA